ncbi:MAG: hypothetical protein ACLR8Y_09090 [Alistipes indistinctus]
MIGDADATAAEGSRREQSRRGGRRKGIVFRHIGDSYDWHITTGRNPHHRTAAGNRARGERAVAPLLVVARGRPSYGGFYIAQGGDYDGKSSKRSTPQAKRVRQIDLSLAKAAFALLFNSALLMLIRTGRRTLVLNAIPCAHRPRAVSSD